MKLTDLTLDNRPKNEYVACALCGLEGWIGSHEGDAISFCEQSNDFHTGIVPCTLEFFPQKPNWKHT